jgi:hypothetical protein
MGAMSFMGNMATGNYVGAVADAVGIAIDATATAVPGMPGGAATALRAARVAEKAKDAAGAYSRYKAGANFSKKTKAEAAARAGNKCEYCGKNTVPAQKSEKGVTPPKNEAHTDHIDPKSAGGTNDPSNAAHACRECNLNHSNVPKQHPRE